ncbi:MAG TPA: hypothetical protein VNE41_02105 [Chitinophagaceae bacterium]|nr:hypothetical protein [Chitinophagaceae bacterium]
MVIINSYLRKNVLIAGTDQSAQKGDEKNNQLAELIRRCVEFIPPHELSRCLRDFFFLYIMDLKEIPEGFNKQVLDILVLFEELDNAEQQNAVPLGKGNE